MPVEFDFIISLLYVFKTISYLTTRLDATKVSWNSKEDVWTLQLGHHNVMIQCIDLTILWGKKVKISVKQH